MFNNVFWKSYHLLDIVVKILITKSTNTHAEYVIFIAFPLQQQLHERASMLYCM